MCNLRFLAKTMHLCVRSKQPDHSFPQINLVSNLFFSFPSLAKEHHGREKRAAEESETSISSSAPLLLPDSREALLCPGLCEWGRGMCLKRSR